MGRRTLRALADAGLRVEGVDVALNVHSTRDDRGCEGLLAERGTGRVQVFANVNADQLPPVQEHLRDRLERPAHAPARPEDLPPPRLHGVPLFVSVRPVLVGRRQAFSPAVAHRGAPPVYADA